MKKLKKLFPIIIFLILIFVSVSYLQKAGKVSKASYSELISGAQKGEIKEISITPNKELVRFKKGSEIKETNIPDISSFLKNIDEKLASGDIKLIQQNESKGFKIIKGVIVYLPTMVLILLLLLYIYLTFRNSKKQTVIESQDALITKSKARLIDKADNDTRFDDVAGIDEEKEELKEIVDFLKNPQKYTQMGARIPKGVLLVGRPGTGKTLLAKAVAGEVGVPFFIISGSDFVEMYSGVGAKRVREMFIEAKKKAPCIIFIDEIDAVGRQRGAGLGSNHDEREQTLNQLLVEMDGFGSNEGVIVLAATNRPDVLDGALLRAGRFDRQIVVSMPDAKAREEILKVHAKNKKLGPNVDLKVVAKNTPGFAGADLENVLNESALLAARKGAEYIETKDIEDAMIKVSMGPEKKSRVISPKERKLVSYHEAGHAVVSYFLPSQEKVHEISIVPRGTAGGYTMYKQSEDKSYISKRDMEEKIISLFGGRLAEEIVLVDISTGASNDIERATKIAQDMVTKYGMSSLVGAMCLSTNNGQVFLGREITQTKNISEKTAALVDDEVKNILDSAYNMGKEILMQNIDKLHKVAQVLIDNEKITGDEFEQIMKS